MPMMSGIQLQEELLAKGHKIPIIFISGESSDEQIVKAFKSGAFDFLLKPFSREDFLSAVERAMEKDSIAMQELIRKSRLDEALKTLSPRELQVFNLLAKGYGNKELVDPIVFLGGSGLFAPAAALLSTVFAQWLALDIATVR